MNGITSISVKDVVLPYILKDKIIFSPGVHNGYKYTVNSIRRGYENTQWNARTQSLYHAHKDEFIVDPETGNKDVHVGAEIDDYAGSIRNIVYSGKGVMRGDIYIWDLGTALKMMGGAKVGISPAGKVKPNRLGEVEDMVIHNWAVTVNPAIKTTFINSEEHWTSCFAMSEDKIVVNVSNMDETTKDKDKVKEKDEGASVPTAEDKLKELTELVSTLTTEVEGLKEKEEKDKDKDKDENEVESVPSEKLQEGDSDEVGEEERKRKEAEKEEAEKNKVKEDNAALAEIMKEASTLSEDEAKVLAEKVESEGLSAGKAGFDAYRSAERSKVQESELNVLKEEVTNLKENLKDVVAKPESILTLTGKDGESAEFGLVEIEDGMKDYLIKIAGSA